MSEKEEGLIKILIVDDDDDYRETYQMLLTRQGYEIAAVDSAAAGLSLLEKEYFPLVITDVRMPGMNGLEFLERLKELYPGMVEVIMVTGYGSVETAVSAMKKGAFSYFIKSHDPAELMTEIQKAEKMIRLSVENRRQANSRQEDVLLNSKSPVMRELWRTVEQVAPSRASILILGESGTGKEVVAQRIHQLGGGEARPFLALNCQQYSEGLMESELFGHEKGAFTGAQALRVGKLEESSGGTVFLDEIGDMDLGTQVKLLRVLETRQIERIGSNRQIHVDFRLISATNQDIRGLVASGRFREDFLYRINTIQLRIPPLRERVEDLEELLSFFIRKFCRETGKRIDRIEENTRSFLMHYHYPGNVRELKNIVERLVILSSGNALRMRSDDQDQGAALRTPKETGGAHQELPPFKEARQEFEKQYIREALDWSHGNITRAARQMGLSRRQLFNKITEYQIQTETE